LQSFANVDVALGEELPDRISLPTRKPSDLQTLESYYAHLVDFTVLLLESPGALAELGTFSMIQNVRPRLFAIVSSEYYRSGSYISRGPLSLLAAHNLNNVIYYRPGEHHELLRRLNYPVSLYKYCSYFGGFRYAYNAKTLHRFPRRRAPDHWEVVGPLYRDFHQSLVLASTCVLARPTFTDLIRHLHLAPADLTAALRELFRANRISKGANGKYVPRRGYQDPALSAFSSTRLSRRRAEMVAA